MTVFEKPLKEPKKKLVAPSILSANFANLEAEIKALAKAGADWIHVDVMDGHFVPNLTIGAPVVKSLRPISPIPLDVHLMVEKPEKYLQAFFKAGADHLTIHVESTESPRDVLLEIRRLGMKAGISLRPGTSVNEVLPLLDSVDLVLVMTVEPGFGGQEFRKDQLEKIRHLRNEIDSRQLPCLIEIDGGVNDKTLQYLSDADVLVAGSFVFAQADYRTAIEALKA